MILPFILPLFLGTSVTGCSGNDSTTLNADIRAETAEVTAITTSHNVGAGYASSFACYATGLSASTIYYIRAYATTPGGAVYGQSRPCLLHLPIRMTIRRLSAGMTSRIRWLQPSIYGRKAIWGRLRTTRTVKALIKTRHRSALI